MKPITIQVCKYCGSEDIKVDAWATWNNRTNHWELASVFDAAFCDQCEGETTAVQVITNQVEAFEQ